MTREKFETLRSKLKMEESKLTYNELWNEDKILGYTDYDLKEMAMRRYEDDQARRVLFSTFIYQEDYLDRADAAYRDVFEMFPQYSKLKIVVTDLLAYMKQFQ
ncbi:MAG: hypothetical protein LBC71_05020 [Oscillospiraceae bacterium]|jgi:hypothetical protein|nr:hypothetical protein [Oscillospiraceae bacterium]